MHRALMLTSLFHLLHSNDDVTTGFPELLLLRQLSCELLGVSTDQIVINKEFVFKRFPEARLVIKVCYI